MNCMKVKQRILNSRTTDSNDLLIRPSHPVSLAPGLAITPISKPWQSQPQPFAVNVRIAESGVVLTYDHQQRRVKPFVEMQMELPCGQLEEIDSIHQVSAKFASKGPQSEKPCQGADLINPLVEPVLMTSSNQSAGMQLLSASQAKSKQA